MVRTSQRHGKELKSLFKYGFSMQLYVVSELDYDYSIIIIIKRKLQKKRKTKIGPKIPFSVEKKCKIKKDKKKREISDYI